MSNGEQRRYADGAAPRPGCRPAVGSVDTRVDVWSEDLAVVTTLFRYPASDSIGRQSQTWLHTDVGWRIIHAHVSERSTTP